jgi:hypothetical protein
VALSVVEKSEDSQEDKACMRKKTIGLQENEACEKDRKNDSGNEVKNASQPGDGSWPQFEKHRSCGFMQQF